MISGHAHSDHVAGHALVKEMTGARVLASEADAVVIGSGGAKGDYRGPRANPCTPATLPAMSSWVRTERSLTWRENSRACRPERRKTRSLILPAVVNTSSGEKPHS